MAHHHNWYVFNIILLACGCEIFQKACRGNCGASSSSTNPCATHR